MKIFRQSLRSKLIGVFLIPTLLIVGLYGFLAYFASRQGLEEELGDRLVAVGQTLSAQWSDGFDAKQIARVDETKTRVLARLREDLQTTRERTGVRRIYVFAEDHESLVDSDPAVEFGQKLYELQPHRAEIARVFRSAEPSTSVLFEGPDGLLYKTGFVPITNDGEIIAVLAVEASAEYFDLLTNFASVLTVLAVLAILLVILVGTVFSRRLVAPINRLVEAARRLGRGDWEAPVTVASDGEDEIAFLASAFEEMRNDIVQRDRQMQMMLSGIAHEVRNPLGGMELFCGLLAEDLGDPDGVDEEAMLAKVRKIQRELEYLERVVTDFLDFAREAPPELERFDAADFASEVEDLLSAEVTDGACVLRTTVGEDGLELTADRQKLRRALINVIRNAYQACGEGGTIELGIRAGAPDQRIIEVLDDGPGIPEDKVQEILAPFFTTKEKGSGLGLALTQRIMAEHGGELVIDRREEGGTAVRLVLPFDPSVESGSNVPEGWLG